MLTYVSEDFAIELVVYISQPCRNKCSETKYSNFAKFVIKGKSLYKDTKKDTTIRSSPRPNNNQPRQDTLFGPSEALWLDFHAT